MPLVHLVLADHDFEYINRLAQWFMENKADRFSVSVFTEKESFKKFVSANGGKIDVILASEDFITDIPANNGTTAILLGQALRIKNLPFVEKYKPAPSIYSEILSAVSASPAEAEKWNSGGKSDLVVCFSTNMYLKSVFAILLCLTAKEHVYVSLESFPFNTMEEDIYFNKNLSDVLYYIKSRKGNPVMALESAVITRENLSFLPPVDNPLDLWELTNDETDTLIEALGSWGHFSRVIVDPEVNAGSLTVKLLKAASCIVVPFDKKHMHQIPRMKRMFSGILGQDLGKVKWVNCGNSGTVYPEELDNYFEITWIDESILSLPSLSDLSLQRFQRKNLEDLLSK